MCVPRLGMKMLGGWGGGLGGAAADTWASIRGKRHLGRPRDLRACSSLYSSLLSEDPEEERQGWVGSCEAPHENTAGMESA